MRPGRRMGRARRWGDCGRSGGGRADRSASRRATEVQAGVDDREHLLGCLLWRLGGVVVREQRNQLGPRLAARRRSRIRGSAGTSPRSIALQMSPLAMACIPKQPAHGLALLPAPGVRESPEMQSQVLQDEQLHGRARVVQLALRGQDFAYKKKHDVQRCCTSRTPCKAATSSDARLILIMKLCNILAPHGHLYVNNAERS